VYAPGSVTEAETFVWYRAMDRLRLGVGYLHKQNAVRWLASFQIAPETATLPSVNASIGVQGIGTGNPGYSVTAEKNFSGEHGRGLNAYTGLGFRSNENHAHWIGGARYSFGNGLALGIQLDGHDHNPFVVYTAGQTLFGFYLIDAKRPAYMAGVRF